MKVVNRTDDTVDLWVISGRGWRHLGLKPDKEGKVEKVENVEIKAVMLISVHCDMGSTMIEISDREIDKVRSFGNCSVKQKKDKGTGELIISIERKA